MNGGARSLTIPGRRGFGQGPRRAPTGDRQVGIVLMGAGLVFQVLTLRQLKLAKKRDMGDAG